MFRNISILHDTKLIWYFKKGMLYNEILIAHRQLTRDSKTRELKIDEEIALLGSYAG